MLPPRGLSESLLRSSAAADGLLGAGVVAAVAGSVSPEPFEPWAAAVGHSLHSLLAWLRVRALHGARPPRGVPGPSVHPAGVEQGVERPR